MEDNAFSQKGREIITHAASPLGLPGTAVQAVYSTTLEDTIWVLGFFYLCIETDLILSPRLECSA